MLRLTLQDAQKLDRKLWSQQALLDAAKVDSLLCKWSPGQIKSKAESVSCKYVRTVSLETKLHVVLPDQFRCNILALFHISDVRQDCAHIDSMIIQAIGELARSQRPTFLDDAELQITDY